MPPKLSIERFATLRADIERSADLDGVLQRGGLLRSEWTAVEKHWQTELAREIAAGRCDLSDRYLAAFFAGGSSPVAPSEPAAPREGKAPQQLLVPTYLAARGAASAPAAPSQPSASSQPISQLQAQVVAQPQAPQPVQISTKADPESTFVAPELAEPRANVVSLPFATDKPKQGLINATFVDDGMPRTVPGKLPFEGKRAAPPAAYTPVRGVGTGTEMLDEGEAGPTASPSVPNGLPALSVDQYAWMTATLRRTLPAEMDAALVRLRLTPASRAELHTAWSAHMDANPAVRAAFMRALAQHFEAPRAASVVMTPPDQSGETMTLDPNEKRAAPTPFEQGALAGWTMEKYATFVADRRAFGIDAIRSQYGVADDAVEQALANHFNNVLSRDGELRSRWILLVAERGRVLQTTGYRGGG